mmetsp:Transcript_148557/g.370189  ORF Transcript_148557/g.370189 Transcript_148557/m.370189 type:complete len:230 (-) Transcript_148557:145-834(-)
MYVMSTFHLPLPSGSSPALAAPVGEGPPVAAPGDGAVSAAAAAGGEVGAGGASCWAAGATAFGEAGPAYEEIVGEAGVASRASAGGAAAVRSSVELSLAFSAISSAALGCSPASLAASSAALAAAASASAASLAAVSSASRAAFAATAAATKSGGTASNPSRVIVMTFWSCWPMSRSSPVNSMRPRRLAAFSVPSRASNMLVTASSRANSPKVISGTPPLILNISLHTW